MKPEVLEGDTWAGKVALALASSHAIQPAHVDATATPEGSNKHNSIEGVAHPLDVVSSADIEVGSSTLLREPGIDVGHQAVTALRKELEKNYYPLILASMYLQKLNVLLDFVRILT